MMAENGVATLQSTDVMAVRNPEDLTLTKLSAQDQQAVQAYADKINVRDTAEVLQFGAQAQEKLTVFADSALANVRNKDAGVVGQTLTDLVAQLEGFSPDKKPSKGIIGLFRKTSSQIASLKIRYDKVESSVAKVAETLEDHRLQMLQPRTLHP